MATVTLQKALGAFYTEQPAATRLVRWAICDASAVVLDPSCGDGSFLAAARSRLSQLGCKSPQIYGIDISPEAISQAHECVREAKLVEQDFFDVDPESLPVFNCIVGNPPFIRYQTFNGNKESRGHSRAREVGVKLPRLASSWAPFVVHAARFLRRGGRLGMVMPTELGHAMYAREVLRFLLERFRHVAIEMFRDKLFDSLSQSTVLLLCDGYGERCRRFIVASADDLEGNGRQLAKADIGAVTSGKFRLTHYVVSEGVRSLYENLAANRRVQRFGEVADVGIGYVTGANDFFHLSDEERQQWDIPMQFLRPAIRNLSGVKDVEYSRDHWNSTRRAGGKIYLLAVPAVAKTSLPASLLRYLDKGESDGVSERYKCRIRRFWYAVPHVRIADGFLSYMSGAQPFLLTNAANLVAPNTVHILKFSRGSDPLAYATSWRNSLTWLSCELEGHALGGGMFKLEPSEAENVLVVRPHAAQISTLLAEMRRCLESFPERATDVADRYVLRRKLGLSKADCLLLRDAALKVELWRKHK